jgi:hypothetical protein
MRSSHLDRDDVLDKVGTLATAGDSEYALTEQVAAYFGTTEEAVDQLVKRNHEELEESGYRSLVGSELRELFDGVTDDTIKISPKTRRLAVFTRRSVLNLAMLMEGNEVAKAVRTYPADVAGHLEGVPADPGASAVGQGVVGQLLADFQGPGSAAGRARPFGWSGGLLDQPPVSDRGVRGDT